MVQTREESSPPERRKPTGILRIQAFQHAVNQPVMNGFADRFKIIVNHGIHLTHVTITDELTVFVKMSGREGINRFDQPFQVFGF